MSFLLINKIEDIIIEDNRTSKGRRRMRETG
jgi:hypothetical protein